MVRGTCHFFDLFQDLSTPGDRFTPLMRAAHFGLLEVALLLLDYGADADARTVTGPFPDFTARYTWVI